MLKLSQVEVNFNWRGTFNAFASARSSVYDRPSIMKEQWSVSKEKLVNLEEGTTLESEPTGLKVVRERRSTCKVLVQYVKLILYVEFALLIGWACYSLWQTYRIESMEVTVGELIGKPHREIIIGTNYDHETTKIDQLLDIQVASDHLPMFNKIVDGKDQKLLDDLSIAEEKLIIAGESSTRKQANDGSEWYVKLATTASPDSEQEFISGRLESSAESAFLATTGASAEDTQILDQTTESTESSDSISNENDADVQFPKRQNIIDFSDSLGPLWSILNMDINLSDKSKKKGESSAVDSNVQDSEENRSDIVVSETLDEDVKDSDETRDRELAIQSEESGNSEESESKNESSEEIAGRHSHLTIAGEALEPFKWLFEDTDSSEEPATEGRNMKSEEEDEPVMISDGKSVLDDYYLDDIDIIASTDTSSSDEDSSIPDVTHLLGLAQARYESEKQPKLSDYNPWWQGMYERGTARGDESDAFQYLNDGRGWVPVGASESSEELKPSADGDDNDEPITLLPPEYQQLSFPSRKYLLESSYDPARLIEDDDMIGSYDYDDSEDGVTLEEVTILSNIYGLDKRRSFTIDRNEDVGTTTDDSTSSENIFPDTAKPYWRMGSEVYYDSRDQFPTAPISKEKTSDKSAEIQWPWFDRAEPTDDVVNIDWNAVTGVGLGDISATVTRIVIGFSSDGFGLHNCTMNIVHGTALPIVCKPADSFIVVSEDDDKRTNEDDVSSLKHLDNVESSQPDNESGMLRGHQNVETIGMTIDDDGIRIWNGLNVEDPMFNDQIDSVVRLPESDLQFHGRQSDSYERTDYDDMILTISEIENMTKLPGVFIPIYDTENNWTQFYKNQNSMMGGTYDYFELYKASRADEDKEWEYIDPFHKYEADDMVLEFRERRAAINVPSNLDESRNNPAVQLFYRNLYDAAATGMQQVPTEQSMNDVDFQAFVDKMTFLAAHIDRLHRRYLHHNELNDDYVSVEFPVEDY